MKTRFPMVPFRELLLNRRRVLEETAARGTKIVGYFCTYTPIEVIHACGMLPVRIWGGSGQAEKAYNLVPTFICPYMRLVMEKALGGEFTFLSGIVQGYTCDVACGMVNVWKGNIPGELYHSLPLPYNDSPESRAFLKAGLDETIEKLTAIGGVYSEESLGRSNELYGKIRGMLAALYERRMQGALELCAADLNVVMQAFFTIPPELFLSMLERLTGDLSAAVPGVRTGVPVLVSGGIVEDEGVMTLVEDLGFSVVADDLCTGLRAFIPVSGPDASPMDRLIARTMMRFPCPSRSRPPQRIPLLMDLVRTSGAKGVIFLLQKFCTPHLADHPMVARALRDAGIPSILIEMDGDNGLEGQAVTRLETFAGMLEA
ncbi:MAG TPA: 2-hydroxyacyl-CoA dehydratase family protein [Deltaproteobacteria bacterium]|nr:MAG: R-phenyllactate dehydratase beta subunit [Deltaproteobacteria bacterium ADurb.Bin072]HNS90653.1 2-hydroxyacyl-CoA dehydratase family protein [Deltaproteobacteria bacterium]HRW80501.1 2-hydroxyacyl-CoA dehydratase family protein [Desulfomonilia bacterium]HOA44988.1 2-hydroxyacyl-CoA dehydratase family protein [Deltaproteobacteria bacterium]HOC76854.1 2-hydroxyacyl-CoA dehydratase family protein [Deltaproteobacteria bacterium]